ncbi:MAG: SH3 domain-containing protein [Bdellovibrionota bacterium]
MKVFKLKKILTINCLLAFAILFFSTLGLCQEEEIDFNSIREQLRQAKQDTKSTDTNSYQKLVEAEKNLLKKLEQQDNSTASAVSVKREVPKAVAPNETTIAVEPKEELKASINTQAAESAAVSETISEVKSNGEFQELEASLLELKSKYEGKSSEYAKIKSNNSNLESKLSSSQSKINKLNSELQEMRNRLMIAETEVERLSAVLEEKKSIASAQAKPKKIATVANIGSQVSIDQGPDREKYVNDMPIGTVVVKKANIRTGPGVNNSPLMTVSRGTRLAVETRKGDWYRIIAPTGVRAWVNSEVIAFGEDYKSSPSATVKIKGYNGEAEEG